MTERPRFSRTVKAYCSAGLHQAARTVAEVPLALRILTAPHGELIRGEEVIASGRIVRYSGDSKVVVTDEGDIVFPNDRAGDKLQISVPLNK